MKDELDEILSKQDQILPSSWFVASVMESVQEETSAPQPIPFPWKRVSPVLAALVAVLMMMIAGIVQFIRMPHVSASTWTISSALQPVISSLGENDAGWIALALVLTLFSTFFSLRLVSGKK